ncbi:MAG: hypothetical protein IJI49_00630 [Bacilli bacterium]|nr:hypothetical protein [Bacilli bacterium]
MKKRNNNLFVGLIILLIIIVASLLIIKILNPNKGELIAINYKEYQNKIKNKDSFILIVSQSTCSHCAEYKPKLIKIAKKNKIDIYYIDYDLETSTDQKEFLDNNNLTGSTPITLFIKHGKQTSLFDRIEGDVSIEKVTDKFKKLGFIK